MKGLITLVLLVATFLGGYHLGRSAAFGDLSGDKVLATASQALASLRRFAESLPGAPKAPEAGPAAQPNQPPQPAQIAASLDGARPGGAQDEIVLHINGKRYVVHEGRR